MNLWTISSQNYVNAVLKNVVKGPKSRPYHMTSKVITSMEKTFLPEIDSSNKLDADGMQNYWKLIVILSWTTEFGRVDIFNELLILVQYEASSRVGHLEKVLHIFSSMKKKPNL